MPDPENPAVTADVVDIRRNQPPGDSLRWESEEARDAFLAEADRRAAEGQSLHGMDLPVAVEQDGGED